MNIESLQKKITDVIQFELNKSTVRGSKIENAANAAIQEIKAARQAAESEAQTFKDYCLIKDLEIGKLKAKLVAAEEENKRLREVLHPDNDIINRAINNCYKAEDANPSQVDLVRAIKADIEVFIRQGNSAPQKELMTYEKFIEKFPMPAVINPQPQKD